MRKIFLLGLIFVAVNAFSQTTLSSDQEKQVKKINKEIQKQVKALQKNETLSADDKKSEINKLRTQQEERVSKIAPAEITKSVKSIDWNKEYVKIDKAEAERLKSIIKAELSDLGTQADNLGKEKKEIEAQIDELKRRKKFVGEQQKALKQKTKETKNLYKSY